MSLVTTPLLRGLASALVVALVASACGAAPTGTTPAPTASTAAIVAFTGPVSMRLVGDWTTLDVQGNSESSGSTIAMSIYDRLVARSGDGKIIPYLATKWEITPTVAKFDLRKDATCADGAPVTPTLVMSSFKRLFDPKTNSFNAPRIFGPGPYTMAADDAAGTFTLTLGTPNSDVLSAFAHYASSVICPAGLADGSKLAQQAFGSGPYQLTEAVHGDHATVKLRKEWKWGPQNTTAADLPEQITFKVTPNTTTAANLIVTGGLDIAGITGPDVPRLLNEKGLTIKESHGFQPYPMILNQSPGRPGADERVREALMSAVDPKAWNQAAFDGRGIISASITVPDVPCYDPTTAQLAPKLDLDRSASLLKTAGYVLEAGKLMKDGKQLSISIISSQTFYQRAAPEYLQAQFNKLGIAATVVDTDQPTFLVNLRGANFDVVVVAASGAPPMISYTPGSMSGAFPPRGSNYGHIVDPELEKGLTTALNTKDCSGWNAVQQLILKKHHAFPLAAPIWHWFTRGIDMQATSSYLEFWSLRKIK